jgi:hypothetical protein
MKKSFLICLVIILASYLNAQNVGIGISSPEAKLDVTSSTSGVLIPRVALTSTIIMAPVISATTSEIIYNTNTAGTGLTAVIPGFYYWEVDKWVPFVAKEDEDWFDITTDEAPTDINASIYTNGLVGIGTQTPKSTLDVEGNVSIGETYSGTTVAPVNGAIIEGTVGIGTNSPENSAQLEVNSTTKGFLPPRMTNAQMQAIVSTESGLMVYEIDCNNLYVFKDTSWELIQTPTTPITTTYNYTGSLQKFTVPTCVYRIEVQLWGAGGGGSGIASYTMGSAGGGGAYVNAYIPVTPGEDIYILVGESGNLTTVVGTTSYGGGGSTKGKKSGYGGGCSGIFSANAISKTDALVVAGGGGGAGYNRVYGNILGGGGGSVSAKGLSIADNGIVNGTQSPLCNASGKGATNTAGGAGSSCINGSNGSAGMVLTDGIVGGFGAVSGSCMIGITNYTTEGGGGGGGYYGGGGGGARITGGGNCDYDSGGGGGGSSFINISNGISLIESAAGEYGSILSTGPGGQVGGYGRKNYSGIIGNGGNGYYGPTGQAGGNGRVVIIY